MSETVVKTIENIDKIFNEISLNGSTVKQRQPVQTSQAPDITPSSQQPQQSTGQKISGIDLNNILHAIWDKQADEDIAEVKATILVMTSDINGIKALIPIQATALNKLADKDFVNSTVGTNTARYISDNGQPFSSVADLEEYSGTVTQNDYAFVTGTDSEGNVYFDRYKADVNDGVVTWAKEYRLNNSSFTAVQWSAINSGITSGDVELIAELDNAITTLQSTVESLSGNVTTLQTDVGTLQSDVSSLQSGKQNKVTISNVDLTDGSSPLATGELYFVY